MLYTYDMTTRLRALGVLLTALFLMSPLFAHAEMYCPNLTQNLQFGSTDAATGGEVTRLQTFFVRLYNLETAEYVSGYFGNRTRDLVRGFQCEHMGLCSGSEEINGYGRVGPSTRAKIAQVCGQTTPTDNSGSGNSCRFHSQTVSHGDSVIAYSQYLQTIGTCLSEARTCSNGVLGGTFTYERCDPSTSSGNHSIWYTQGSYSNTYLQSSYVPSLVRPSTYSQSSYYSQGGYSVLVPLRTCSFNGRTLVHGGSVTAYQSSTAGASGCVRETRSCNDGVLSGSYTYSTCQENTNTYSQASYYSQGTYNTYSQATYYSQGTYNTYSQATYYSQGSYNTGSGVGSCMYKGTSYAERHTLSIPLGQNSQTLNVVCDNGIWAVTDEMSPIGARKGADVCDHFNLFKLPGLGDDLHCPSERPLTTWWPVAAVTPSRAGSVPFTIQIVAGGCGDVAWGDGQVTDIEPVGFCHALTETTLSHTYTSPGSYRLSVRTGTAVVPDNTEQIRVSAVTSQGNSYSQIASVLAAIQALLEKIK